MRCDCLLSLFSPAHYLSIKMATQGIRICFFIHNKMGTFNIREVNIHVNAVSIYQLCLRIEYIYIYKHINTSYKSARRAMSSGGLKDPFCLLDEQPTTGTSLDHKSPGTVVVGNVPEGYIIEKFCINIVSPSIVNTGV